MVKRQVSLTRIISANQGKIFGAFVWLCAAGACTLLYSARATPRGGVAMALVREAAVRAPESGRLARVDVEPGQIVQAGDPIATVDVPGLTSMIAAAEARLAGLRAEAALSGVDRARKFAKDADANRARWLSAQVDLESAKARLAGIDLELARITAPGIEVPKAQIEQTQAQRTSIMTEITARTAEVDALKRATAGAESRGGLTGDAVLDAQIAEAGAELDALKARQDSLLLRAPVTGVVDSRVASIGEWVVGGDALTVLHLGQTDQALVYVGTVTARELAQSRPLVLHGPKGEQLNGIIRSVGAAVEAVPAQQLRDPAIPEFGVPVLIDVKDRTLVPGETLAVQF